MDEVVAEGRQIGRRLAGEVLAARREAREQRGLVEAAPRGIVVAEGDSWFDYPGGDILSRLADDYNWDVRSVAHRGDNLESMAYDERQLTDLLRVLEQLALRGERPAAVLISGGGNDLAGPELAMALEHARSGRPLVNDTVIAQLIDERMRRAFVALVTAVQEVARETLGGPLPIVVHGYAYPVPDGRGFLGGWGPLPGPWLEPSFTRKGVPVSQLELSSAAMRTIVGRFTAMLVEVSQSPGIEQLHVVDVTDELPSGEDYASWWANELHPTAPGFDRVTALIAAELDAIASNG